jgi:plasmid segregation protein ParM
MAARRRVLEILGIDIGFGFTKATSGSQDLLFKSLLGEATDIQFREQMLPGGVGGEDHLQVEVDGKGYFVGELADRQSNVRFFTLDQAQFISKFAKVLALTATARLVKGFIPVNLVTGLPIGAYRKHKDELARLLAGEHKVVLTDASGRREEKSLSIGKVRVIPQPFGCLFNQMLNEQGELADRRLVREKIGIIDIGFRTADYTISDKMRYSERGSRTTDAGIARAFSVIAAKLRDSSGVNVELYRLYEAIERGSIKIRGKSYDLQGMTEQVFGQLAATVANEIDRLWADDWDMDAMVITGGGGAVLAKHLQPLLNGEVLTLDPKTDMRLYNVQGYRKFGQHLWGRSTVPAAPAPPVKP